MTKKSVVPATSPKRQDVRTCFVIMPFSVKFDPARGDLLNFDSRVYDRIIGPAIKIVTESGIPMRVVRADKIPRARLIYERMIQHIADADVAIVDITTANANVLYRLGVRHALRDRATVGDPPQGHNQLAQHRRPDPHRLRQLEPLSAQRAIVGAIRNGLLYSAPDSPIYKILPDLKVERLRPSLPESTVEGYPVQNALVKRSGIVTDGLRRVNTASTLRGEPNDVLVSLATKARHALKVFLCHSSGDKPAVRELHESLGRTGYDPWLDEDKLLPGQDWDPQIRKAVRQSHVVIVCLSTQAASKAGFVQKEIRLALDVADEQPEGRIYIIPARLEPCQLPDRLSKWHWVNLFDKDGYEKLMASLDKRASELLEGSRFELLPQQMGGAVNCCHSFSRSSACRADRPWVPKWPASRIPSSPPAPTIAASRKRRDPSGRIPSRGAVEAHATS